MSSTVIRIWALSKQYRLGQSQSYRNLRDVLTSTITAPLKRLTGRARVGSHGTADGVGAEHIWALRDVSCEIRAGEAVGIIGRNGAGKSTLLKILSRITEPTSGRIEICGRVGSLLEVGTGFHPELTGRENIYLNGAILGMRKSEIEARFDEIVAFAEVDKFVDTPMKRYSSGMYVRLAFAVAAYMEPEILLVDEVLAVGDTAFQKKCLNKLNEVSGQGRTVLFVSHNMGAIKSLTRTALWLDNGRIAQAGESEQVVNSYLASSVSQATAGVFDADHMAVHRVHLPQKYIRRIELTSVTLRDVSDQITGVFLEGQRVNLELKLVSLSEYNAVEAIVRVRTMDGQLLFTLLPGRLDVHLTPGAYTARIGFDLEPLLPGLYRGDVVLLSNVAQDNVSPAFQFEVIPAPEQAGDFRTVLFGTSNTTASYAGLGVIRVRSTWEGFKTTGEPC